MKETEKILRRFPWDAEERCTITKSILRATLIGNVTATVLKAIPDEKDTKIEDVFEKMQRIGWNDCRRAALKKLEDFTPGIGYQK